MTPDEVSMWKDVAAIVAAGVALVTLVLGVREHRQQGKQQRAASFLDLRVRRDSEPVFTRITRALNDDHPALKAIEASDKRYFLALLEEVALMVNSRLVPMEVAHYMFGSFAIQSWDIAEFWENMLANEKDHSYWSLYRGFVEQMRIEETSLEAAAGSYRTLRARLRF